MLTSGLPASLRDKYPQFKVGSVEQMPSKMETNLDHQRKTQEIRERLQRTSPLFDLMGDNLVTLTHFDGSLALNLMFLDLQNIREREKTHRELVDFFDKTFGTSQEDIDAREKVRLELWEDTEGRYEKAQGNTMLICERGMLHLKGDVRYFVRHSQDANLFQYLLNRDQYTYQNLPVSDWNYQRSALKTLYVAVFRALRETKWK